MSHPEADPGATRSPEEARRAQAEAKPVFRIHGGAHKPVHHLEFVEFDTRMATQREAWSHLPSHNALGREDA